MSERLTKWTGWFERVRGEFEKVVMPYAGNPLTYVEVGVWAGASARWACENLLVHPRSRGIGIDPYDATLRPYSYGGTLGKQQADLDAARAKACQRLIDCDRFKLICQPSHHVLRNWQNTERTAIDVLYLDGRHEAPLALQDFVLAWPYLTHGGLVIFDDFETRKPKVYPHIPEAAAAIMLAFKGLVEVAHIGRQIAFHVRKKETDDNWLRQRALRGQSYSILGVDR